MKLWFSALGPVFLGLACSSAEGDDVRPRVSSVGEPKEVVTTLTALELVDACVETGSAA